MHTDIDDHILSEWIYATALHEHTAFEQLYGATSPQVFALLKRMLHTDFLAEEALETIFINVWHQAGTYQSSSNDPRAWIVGIARDHAINELRRQKTGDKVDSAEDKSDKAKKPLQPFPTSEQNKQAKPLDNCLEHLEDSVRECVLRAYCEGLSYEELSEYKRQSVDTIKDEVRQGLLALRECLDEQQ